MNSKINVKKHFLTRDIFNIATHSNFGTAFEASKMDIMSSVVCINGSLRYKSHHQWCILIKDSLPL